MKQDLRASTTTPKGIASEEHLKEIALLYGVSVAEAPGWLTYDKAMASWRSRVSVLVTCLAMGGTHYANEMTLIRDDKAKAVPTPVNGPFGETVIVNVIPSTYSQTPAERKALAAKSDKVRSALCEFTEIPKEKWSALAERVMATPSLIRYVGTMGLLPPRPKKINNPKQDAPR